MQRVSVVGNSGSGKSHLARRLAGILDVPCTELDAIHHLPGWTPIDPDAFLAAVTAAAEADAWVRESLRNLWAWDPDSSIIRWAWTQHAAYRERYRAAMASPAFGHIDFVRLTSREDVDEWLRSVRAAR